MTPEPADTFEHAGLGVRILWDEYNEHANPRADDGNIGVMFCEYPRYNLGDEDAPDPRDQRRTCEKCDGEGYLPWDGDEGHYRYVDDTMICERCAGDGEVEVGVIEYLKREHGAKVILPLFVYEHGGITMQAGGRLDTGEDSFRRTGRFMGDAAGWDTSSVGVIFDTAETRAQLSQEWQEDDEKIAEILRDEVALYAAYLEGSVFGYEVVELDEDGEVPTGRDAEVLDSCWGFLETASIHSDDAYVRHEAKEAAEAERQAIDAEKAEADYWRARDVETVG